MDVQTSPKFDEHYGRLTLGEDVGILGRSRYMKNTDVTKSDAFPDEVEVDLNVLGALVLYRVRREVDDTDVVTEEPFDVGPSAEGSGVGSHYDIKYLE